MATKFNIVAARGETVKVDIPLDTGSAFWNPECTMEMTLRISRRGRRFAKISSDNRQIDYTLIDGDSPRVSLLVSASALVDIPAVTYVYDLWVQCETEKSIVASGFFHFDENTNHESDLPSVGTIDCEPASMGGDPVIASSNEALQVCCGRPEPLYFEVNAGRGVKRIWVETDFGESSYEAYYEGKWIKDNSFALNTNRYRVVFVRFPRYVSGTPAWRTGQWKGGEGCEKCSAERECDDFCMGIVVRDSTGVEVRQKFCVDVSSTSSLETTIAQFDSTPRGEIATAACSVDGGSASLESATFSTYGCSVFPGSLVVLGGV